MTHDQLEKIEQALAVKINQAVFLAGRIKSEDFVFVQMTRQMVKEELAKPDQSARIAELEAEVERLSIDLAMKDRHGH